MVNTIKKHPSRWFEDYPRSWLVNKSSKNAEEEILIDFVEIREARDEPWNRFALCAPEIPQDIIDAYDGRYNVPHCMALFNMGIMPDEANDAPPYISGQEYVQIRMAKINLEVLDSYPDRFPYLERLRMYKANITEDEAEEAPVRFNGLELVVLKNRGMPFDEAANAHPDLSMEEILLLNGLGFETIDTQELSASAISIIHEVFVKGYFKEGLGGHRYAGRGAKALVFRQGDVAWKFAKDVEREYKLLKLVSDENGKKLKNVVRLMGKPKMSVAIPIEYIEGRTLSEILTNHQPLSPKRVLRYTKHLVNGVYELRVAGIYHRDLHVSNVMIARGGIAKIIDLDAATENPEDFWTRCRAFGGNNDLVSLGQLMYKMATGSNLFNETEEETRLSDTKNAAQEERFRVYGLSPEGRRSFLIERIGDLGALTEPMLLLLDDELMVQPDFKKVKKIRKMFRGYSAE